MQVCRIRKYVVRYLLKKYLEKCQELHHIAFLQWRKKYPSDVRHHIEEIQSLLETRILNLINSKNPN